MTPATRLHLMSSLYAADTGKQLDVEDPVSTQAFSDWTKSRALESALQKLHATRVELEALTSTTAEWRYHARIGATIASFFAGVSSDGLQDPSFCVGVIGSSFTVEAAAVDDETFEGVGQSGDLATAASDAVDAFLKSRRRRVN